MAGESMSSNVPLRPVRVRQVPAAHAYVEHLLPVAGGGSVVHLPDPPVPGAPPGQWWPHPALDAAWVAEHADEQDVLHLHFGMEGRTTAELDSWIEALRRARLPLVHTVHDLDHPHLRDQRRHREHLALLVEHADGLLTLTEGAADVVERRHGRRPLVIAHPHVVPLDRLRVPSVDQRRAGSGAGARLRVGVHLKSLRTNLDPVRVMPPLVEAVGRVRAAGLACTLEVRVHPEVLAEGPTAQAPVLALLQDLRATAPPGVELVSAPRLGDEELWDYLEGLDVSVLPYAWGTHSGWVEACRDLGTWVLAPDVGHVVEQGGVLAWGPPARAPRVEVLVELLTMAADRPASRVPEEQRAQERDRAAAAHEAVYREVLAGRRVDGRSPGEEMSDG